MRYLFILSMIGLSLFHPAVLTPQETEANGPQHLQIGVEQAYNMDIEAAIQSLQTALRLGLDKGNRIQAYLYLALMYKADGQTAEAEAALSEILKLNGEYQLPSDLVETDFDLIFQWAKANADMRAPIIRSQGIQSARAGNAIDIQAIIEDDGKIQTATLTYAHSQDSRVHSVEMQASGVGEYRAQIPKEAVKKGLIQYQITATDAWNNKAQTEPIRVEIKGGSRVRWYLGALLGLAGGVAGYALLRGEGEWPESLPPGPPNE